LLCQAQVLKTRLKMAKGTRAWCFTLNNYTEEERDALRSLKCKYIVFGYERGEEGTPHLQGYVHLSTQKTPVGDEEVHPESSPRAPSGYD